MLDVGTFIAAVVGISATLLGIIYTFIFVRSRSDTVLARQLTDEDSEHEAERHQLEDEREEAVCLYHVYMHLQELLQEADYDTGFISEEERHLVPNGYEWNDERMRRMWNRALTACHSCRAQISPNPGGNNQGHGDVRDDNGVPIYVALEYIDNRFEYAVCRAVCPRIDNEILQNHTGAQPAGNSSDGPQETAENHAAGQEAQAAVPVGAGASGMLEDLGNMQRIQELSQRILAENAAHENRQQLITELTVGRHRRQGITLCVLYAFFCVVVPIVLSLCGINSDTFWKVTEYVLAGLFVGFTVWLIVYMRYAIPNIQVQHATNATNTTNTTNATNATNAANAGNVANPENAVNVINIINVVNAGNAGEV